MDFAFENTRRVLTAERKIVGALVPAGHRYSNLIEARKNLLTATDPVQIEHLRVNIAMFDMEIRDLKQGREPRCLSRIEYLLEFATTQ